MKILVFTQSEWDNVRAFGNTLSNFFGGEEWIEDSFSNIYTRKSLPNNAVCNDYYSFSIEELLKNIFSKESIGKHFFYPFEQMKEKQNKNGSVKEKKIIEFLHSLSNNGIIYYFIESLFRKKWWDNKKFRQYLQEIQPDIFFTYLGDDGLVKPMIECVKKYTNAKVVLFSMDDLYGKYGNYKKLRREDALEGFEWSVENADRLYGISSVLCKEYGEKFKKVFTPLYKGCEFYPLKKCVNEVIRIVYAGNLYYGRDDTLMYLANAIKRINKNEQKMILEIYSGAVPTDETMSKLNVENASRFMGRRSFDEIKKILHEADIVLHVESFDPKQIEYVHYSFSTKIIDCLQSGNLSMAIGPKGIASIEYLRDIKGTVVLDDLELIEKELQGLVNNPSTILERASSIRDFSIENHDIHIVRAHLRRDFEDLLCSK